MFGTGEEKRKADVDKSRELAKEVEERASRLEAKPKLDIYDPSKYKKKNAPYDPNELGPIDKPKSPPRASRLEAKLKEQAARKADVDKARELAKEAEERASRLEAKLEEQAKKEKNEQQKLFEKLQREQEIKLAAEKKRIEEESRKKEDERIKKLTEKKTAELKEIQEKELKRIEKLKETELLAERKKIKELEEQLALLNKKQKEKNKLVTKQSAKTIPVEWQAYSSDMSLQQKQFCSLTERFFEDMDNAQKTENQIRVNMVHKERQENFDGLLPNGVINNWIFRVVKIEQVEDGSAAVVLELQCKAFVGSGQIYSSKKSWNAKEKKEWRATIPYEDRRFRELAKLAKGQFVLASGVLLEIDAFKPGQVETFYASQSLGEHPLTKGLNLKGELFVADLKYIAAID